MSITALAAIQWLRREFLLQFRESAERLALPLEERLERGKTVAGLTVVAKNGRKTTTLRTATNRSGIRKGDSVYPHPEHEPIDPEDGGLCRWGKSIESVSADGKEFVIKANLADGETWCFDVMANGWSPLSSRPAVIAAGLAVESALSDKWRRWLGGEAEAHDGEPLGIAGLTERQAEATRAALHDEVAVIQGPPGTGKTWLLAAILCELVARGERVLVSCSTHAAIDNVLRAVYERNPKVPLYRIGGGDGLPDSVQRFKELPAPSGPGVFGMTVFGAAKPLARSLEKAAPEPEQPEDGGFISAEDWLASYTAAWDAHTAPDPAGEFDVVVIDEAGQMPLPHACSALVHGKRLIAVGDHRQLPPVAQTPPPFAPSIFDHLVAAYRNRVVMLDTTFRMNATICESPSRLFYGAALVPSPSAADRKLDSDIEAMAVEQDWLRMAADPDRAVILLSVEDDTSSDGNPYEARAIGLTAALLLARSTRPADETLAIVCPHRRQNNLVKRALAKAAEALPDEHRARVLAAVDDVVCDTVERIQGQERECILVSLTGSDPDHLSGQWAFSHCPRRFNVAITRPKTKLIVAGSPNFFHFTPPDGNGTDLASIAALKRWYLDRMDRDEIVEVPT